jgi:hypothetical protein
MNFIFFFSVLGFPIFHYFHNGEETKLLAKRENAKRVQCTRGKRNVHVRLARNLIWCRYRCSQEWFHISCSGVDFGPKFRMNDPVHMHDYWFVVPHLTLRSRVLESIWCVRNLTSCGCEWLSNSAICTGCCLFLILRSWFGVTWDCTLQYDLVSSDRYLGCLLSWRTVTLLTGVMWFFCCWHEACKVV